jgi:hypothetical protein
LPNTGAGQAGPRRLRRGVRKANERFWQQEPACVENVDSGDLAVVRDTDEHGFLERLPVALLRVGRKLDTKRVVVTVEAYDLHDRDASGS